MMIHSVFFAKHSVRGTIVEASGEPLIGVNVVEKGLRMVPSPILRGVSS